MGFTLPFRPAILTEGAHTVKPNDVACLLGSGINPYLEIGEGVERRRGMWWPIPAAGRQPPPAGPQADGRRESVPGCGTSACIRGLYAPLTRSSSCAPARRRPALRLCACGRHCRLTCTRKNGHIVRRLEQPSVCSMKTRTRPGSCFPVTSEASFCCRTLRCTRRYPFSPPLYSGMWRDALTRS